MDYAPGAPVIMVLWGLIGLALLVLLVVAIIWLLRRMTPPAPQNRSDQDPAEEDLRRRYAAGEIDQEEYQRRLRDLRDQ